MYFNQVKFGCRLRNLRKQRRMTQEALAGSLNISIDHLSKIEHGKRGVSIDLLLDKIESSGVPTTEDIRQRRLELDKLLQTPPVDEEIARQKAMELAVLTLVSVEMEEYEARRLRSIFGKQAKMRELDANLLRQNVRKITYGSKTVKVLLKNNQVLEECDDA